MKLDWNASKDVFVLYVPRAEADPDVLLKEFGMQFSKPASTLETACLFTREPYKAASFAHCATDRARVALTWITERIDASWAANSGRHLTIPPDRELWPFQRASAAYCLERVHALDGDQPGLGKTPTAIIINNEIQARHTLVVVPASIRHQWADRIREWDIEELSRTDIQVILSSKRGVWTEQHLPKWTVISWELVHDEGLWRALAKCHFDHLILDEAHYAKHGTTKRARAIFGGGDTPAAGPLIECSEKVTALAGTPLPKRLQEAYVLARGLCFDAIDYQSQDDFNEKYNPIQSGMFTQANGDMGFYKDESSFCEAELQNRMRANYMVRHLKRDVMKDLQYPVFDLIRVNETKTVKAALEAEKLLDIDWKSLMTGGPLKDLGPIASARRLMGIAMAPQVADYIEMLLEAGERKLVVFAWHIDVVSILEQRLGKWGVIRVDGSDGAKRKYQKVQEFVDEPAKNIIIGNVLSLGTGTDGLQKVAWHGLMAEADWTHGNNEQCADRLDRGGQDQKVQFDIFVAPGSIAEMVLMAALRDAETTHKALDRRVEDRVWLKP